MDEQRPFRVCAINGSSRKEGQTARRLGTIVEGLRKRGVRVDIIHLARTPLDFSDGDQEPRRRPPDIRPLLDKLEKADGIIFGTPTYWFNMSALMKNLLDRLIITEKDDKYTLEGIVAGFVATGEAKEDGAMIALSSMAATANHLGMVTFPYSMIYFRGSAGPDWAERNIKEYAGRMLTMMELVRTADRECW